MPDEVKPKLDAFTAKVVGDPSKPQDTMLIQGFVGASSEDKHTRIYTDVTLDKYIDVANKDIVHSEPLPKEQSPLGGSYIWVRKSAEVVGSTAGGERKKAKFLEGPIAAQAVPGAAGSGLTPYANTQQLVLCHPTVILQTCPTRVCPITLHGHFCPPVTVVAHCYPSAVVHCLTIATPCFPTEACPVTLACPQQTIACGVHQTVACGVTIACGGGQGGGGPEAVAQQPIHVTKTPVCHLPTPSPLHCPTPWHRCNTVDINCGGGGIATSSPLFCPTWFGWAAGPC